MAMRVALFLAAMLGHAREVVGDSCTSVVGAASNGWCMKACSADPTLDECDEVCKCDGNACKGIDLVALADKWCGSNCGEDAEDPEDEDCADYCVCPSSTQSGVYLRKNMGERPLPLWAAQGLGAGECVSVIGAEADAWCDRMCYDNPDSDDCMAGCDCSEDNSSGCISTTNIAELASGWCENKCAATPDTLECKELCRCPAVAAH